MSITPHVKRDPPKRIKGDKDGYPGRTSLENECGPYHQ